MEVPMYRRIIASLPKSIADLDTRLAQPQMQRKLLFASRMIAPFLVAFAFGSVAHAQGTMDFSGAQTLMGTFNAGPSTIQSKVEFLKLFEVVTEDPMCAVEGQGIDIRKLENGMQRGVFLETQKIRK
jgi:hypothetical protein